MSTFATLLALSHRCGAIPAVTARQAYVLEKFFDIENLNVLEEIMPEWWRIKWKNPFK